MSARAPRPHHAHAASPRAAAFVFGAILAIAAPGAGAGCAQRGAAPGLPQGRGPSGDTGTGDVTAKSPDAPRIPGDRGRRAASDVLRLQHQLDAIFGAPDFESASWGILIRSLRTDETLFERSPTKLMVPASSMKVVTLAATAERLGWDFRFDTRLGTAAPIEDGVVRGDIVVQGNGDPSIVRGEGRWSPAFDALAAQLVSGGVRRIDGNLIGDDNAFEDRGYGVNWAWDDFAYDYSAPIGALQYHENTVELRITAGAEGEVARVEVADPAAGLTVTSSVMTVAATSPTIIDYERAPGGGRLLVTGQVAADAEPQVRLTAVENPTLYFVRALRTALVGHGIEVVGDAVDIDDLAAPPRTAGGTTGPLQTLATYQSPRLLEMATRLMKVSQNLIAETFFKQLGLVSAPPSSTRPPMAAVPAGPRVATAAAGREALGEILTTSWGLDPGQFVIWDGSGLSRRDFVSPLLVVTALTRMAQNPAHKDAFTSTLPIGGRDGSLEHRMKGSPAEGNVRAKTGSMSQVRSLSGYVTTADGEPLVFSIITNGFTAPTLRVDEAVDSAMDALARFRR